MKCLIVFGTRPEAIKLAPLILALQSEPLIDVKLCVTAQHRQMLDQVLDLFAIMPDFDLNLMKSDQSLTDITTGVLFSLRTVLSQWRPDVVLVHGDTSTTFAAAFAAFIARVPVGHVEAGLRTGNLDSPWPEEANRKLTSVLASWHFAPTEKARANLLAEGISPGQVYVTGNTVIDALLHIKQRIETDSTLERSFAKQFGCVPMGSPIVLVTAHRRENFGDGFERICDALHSIAISYPTVHIVFPVHLNPHVQEPVRRRLGGLANVHLFAPLDYLPFVYLMKRCSIILTDSGGIQEEASALGKPVLVMRDTTERPEALNSGAACLVGTNVTQIVAEVSKLLDDPMTFESESPAHSPFGDGKASKRIVDILLECFTRPVSV